MNLVNEAVTLMKNYGVVKIDHKKPFTLASGKISPYYFDHRRIFSVPELRNLIISLWSQKIQKELKIPLTDVCFAGTATAGIAPAYALAQANQASFIYVRAQAKSHGTGNLVEGVWDPAQPTIVVDDMVTTGKSLLQAAEQLRSCNTQLIAAACITQQINNDVEFSFQNAGLRCISLFNVNELLN